jgi:hypothetical protein
MKARMNRPASFGLTALLAVIAGSAQAKDDWHQLPYERAYAYAYAADQYCFLGEEISNAHLLVAALTQHRLRSSTSSRPLPSLDEKMEDAAEHLRSDQSACAPAVAFINRAKTNAAEDIVRMDLAIAVQKNQATEAEAKRIADDKAARAAELAKRDRMLGAVERIKADAAEVKAGIKLTCTEPNGRTYNVWFDGWSWLATDLFSYDMVYSEQRDGAYKLAMSSHVVGKRVALTESFRINLDAELPTVEFDGRTDKCTKV